MRIGTFVEYKGYTGSIEYSPEDKIHYGSLLYIKDFINYEANTVEDLFDEFHKAVDDYLSMCESIQKQPDIPSPINVRKVQHYADSKGIWCYYDGEENNPCGCGSNCYHYEYDGEKIYGVCNACKTDIYEMKPEYVEEKLKQGVWK